MKASELKERVHAAVLKGFQARADYYSAIQLDEDQVLGKPAGEAQIARLEERLGKNLPPSYREFLSQHDGWHLASGSLDLVSVVDLVAGPVADEIRQWQEERRASGDLMAANALVIGMSDVTPTRLLLDPSRKNEDGEWTVAGYHHREEDSFETFLAWLEASAESFEKLLEQEPTREARNEGE